MGKIVRLTESELTMIIKKVVKESMGSKNNLMFEQDKWIEKAASGHQICGKRAKWGGYPSDDDSVSGEKCLSGKGLKKYNKSLYDELLKSSGGSDYEKRRNDLTQTLNSVPGSISTDQKFSLIYNLTSSLIKNKDWFFNRFIKNELNLPADSIITDKNMLDFINKKGGFDKFKEYYINEILS